MQHLMKRFTTPDLNNNSLVLKLIVEYLKERNDSVKQLQNICQVSTHFKNICENILNIRHEKNTRYWDAEYSVCLIFAHVDYTNRHMNPIPFTLFQLAHIIQNIERRLLGKVSNKIKLHSCNESGFDFNSIISDSNNEEQSIRFSTADRCICIPSDAKGINVQNIFNLEDCQIIDDDRFSYREPIHLQKSACALHLVPKGNISLYQYKVVIEEICKETGATPLYEFMHDEILPKHMNKFQQWIVDNKNSYTQPRLAFIRCCMNDIVIDPCFPTSENPIEYLSYSWWRNSTPLYIEVFLVLYKRFAIDNNIELWEALQPYIKQCSHTHCENYCDYYYYTKEMSKNKYDKIYCIIHAGQPFLLQRILEFEKLHKK